eukprot:scaffold158_cov228-Pinguiococcus_pyrenoidosus.AAC.1
MGLRCSRSADHIAEKGNRSVSADPQKPGYPREDSGGTISKRQSIESTESAQTARRTSFQQPWESSTRNFVGVADLVRRNRLLVRLALRDTLWEEQLPVMIHPSLTKVAALQVHNATSAPVMFKMKTTNPDDYKVKPVRGILSAGETMDVFIFLEPRLRNILVVDPHFQKPGKMQICHCELPEHLAEDDGARDEVPSGLWKSIPDEQLRYVKVASKFVFPEQQEAAEADHGDAFVVPLSGQSFDSASQVVFVSVDRQAGTVKAVIQAFNDLEGPAIFRVKTTSPDMYVVRPAQGVIQAQEAMCVVISAQRSWLDALLRSLDNATLPDGGRFLVQSMRVSPSLYDDLSSIEDKGTTPVQTRRQQASKLARHRPNDCRLCIKQR